MASTILTLFLALTALFPERQEPPKGPAPKVMIASLEAGKPPMIHLTSNEFIPQEELIVEKGVGVSKKVVRAVTIKSKIVLDAKHVQVYRADGKPVDLKEVATLLSRPTVVMVSANFKAVDPAYLKFAREETLVIVPAAP
jgi:hypothetical protein